MAKRMSRLRGLTSPKPIFNDFDEIIDEKDAALDRTPIRGADTTSSRSDNMPMAGASVRKTKVRVSPRPKGVYTVDVGDY